MADVTETIVVLGLPVDGMSLPPEHERFIAKADLLVGGTRHLDRFGTFRGETLAIKKDIKGILDAIAKARDVGKTVVVLATGDPLWFGIGTTLIRRFGRKAVTVLPAVASPQVALARLGLSMDRAIVLSRHKASDTDLDLLRYFAVGVVLTSGDEGPARIAQDLMERIPAAANWSGAVCQRLGSPDEAIVRGVLLDFTGTRYLSPNLLVVQNPDPLDPFVPLADFGRPDTAFAHQKGLITHPEVRAVALSKLELGRARILWDVGAGSGAVGIEAACLNPALSVHAIEKNPGRIRQIAANRESFRARNLTLHAGNMVEILPFLPRPDRIFVGGGGKDLPVFLAPLFETLLPEGIVVAATITLESFQVLTRFVQDCSLPAEVIQLQVARMTSLADYHKMTPDNPITLFKIRKQVDT